MGSCNVIVSVLVSSEGTCPLARWPRARRCPGYLLRDARYAAMAAFRFFRSSAGDGIALDARWGLGDPGTCAGGRGVLAVCAGGTGGGRAACCLGCLGRLDTAGTAALESALGPRMSRFSEPVSTGMCTGMCTAWRTGLAPASLDMLDRHELFATSTPPATPSMNSSNDASEPSAELSLSKDVFAVLRPPVSRGPPPPPLSLSPATP